ncbi:MAG: hypothetical protein QW041_00455 [Candidatus Pacearchaeota archaeon]
MKKRGQIEISFQLIFSLILIATFIYAAIYGIRYFLETADLAKINYFNAELQSKVETAWLSTEISQDYELSLPTRIKYVCFSQPNDLTLAKLKAANIPECADFENYIITFRDMNMFFCPAEKVWKIGAPIYIYINCKGKDCLQFEKTPYCIKNEKGKVKIKLEKNYGETKIRLS